MRPQSFEIASWVSEQLVGQIITGNDIQEALSWVSRGAISGTLYRLSMTSESPMLKLVGKSGNVLEYEILHNDLSKFNFRKSFAPNTSPKRKEGFTRKQRMLNSPLKPGDREPSPQYVKALITAVRRYNILQELEEEELWAELQRRDSDEHAK